MMKKITTFAVFVGLAGMAGGAVPGLRKPLEAVFEDSALYRWSGKEVFARGALVDMADSSKKPAGVKMGSEYCKSSSQCFMLRPPGEFTLNFNKADWSAYNRLAFWVYPKQTTENGIMLVQVEIRTADKPEEQKQRWYNGFRQCLRPNEWNHVIWEIGHLEQRDKVESVRVFFANRAAFPEEEMDVVVYVDDMAVERVDADVYEGWEVGAGDISFSHIGYKPSLSKTAICSGVSVPVFQVLDVVTNEVVLEKAVKTVQGRLGEFQVLDFSELRTVGRYVLKVGDVVSKPFAVEEDVWRGTVFDVLNFFYCQRDACEIPGIQPWFRNQDAQGYHPDTPWIRRLIPGAWHDAADTAEWLNNTSNITYNLFCFAEKLGEWGTDRVLYERMLEEAKFGLAFLLRSNFGDGYRIVNKFPQNAYKKSFTESVKRPGYGQWSDGIPGNEDDEVVEAQNSPAQNLVCAAAEAKAWRVLKEDEPEMASRSLAMAKEDWLEGMAREEEWRDELGGNGRLEPEIEYTEQTINYTTRGAYYTCSWAVIASIELFEATGDQKYAQKAIECGRVVLACQEKRFLNEKGVTGYFYTNADKVKLAHHYHHGREYAPLVALERLCEAFEGHEDWMDWYAAMVIHSEYFLKAARYSEPYELLPNGVYREDDYLLYPQENQGECKRQILEGMDLGKAYRLRFFAPWSDIARGGNDTLLGANLALCAAGHVRDDLGSEELAQKQLQWVIGRNPFCKSTVWGVGYDYLDLLSVAKGLMVGTVPVGIDCYNGDSPFWPTQSYFCAFEAWVESSARFIWNVAYLSGPGLVRGTVKPAGLKWIRFEEKESGEIVEAAVDKRGTFNVRLGAGEYVVRFGDAKRSVTVLSGKVYRLDLDADRFVNFDVSKEMEGETVAIKVGVSGRGRHTFDVKGFNLQGMEGQRGVSLEGNATAELVWQGCVVDANMPWVAVVTVDGDGGRKELFGDVAY